MLKTLGTISLLFVLNSTIAQSVWTGFMLRDANTANHEHYLTATEKEVIFYLNLVRSNPALFEKTYLKKFLDSTKTNNSFTKSLIKTLKAAKPIQMLEPNEDLFETAKAHAVRFGRLGKIGHDNFADRMKQIKTKFGDMVAENCDYGNDKALDIVISLLIDDGDATLGHRNNILDANYKYIGASIQAHKKYEWSCVMDFGGEKK